MTTYEQIKQRVLEGDGITYREMKLIPALIIEQDRQLKVMREALQDLCERHWYTEKGSWHADALKETLDKEIGNDK